MTLERGTRLGHYRIVGLLGRGGMAETLRLAARCRPLCGRL